MFLGIGLTIHGALNKGVRGLSSLFSGGRQGFLFDGFSDLTLLFTSSIGEAPVASDSDTVGLMLDRSAWGGQTLLKVLNSQTILAASGYTTSVNGGTGTATESPSGQINLTGGSAVVWADKSFTTTSGELYQVSFSVESSPVGMGIGVSTGGVELLASVTYSVGTHTRYFIASSSTSWIRFIKSAATLATVRDIKIRRVPGNHAIQNSNNNFRPLWKENSGKPYIVGDKVDDRLPTPFVPTAALTFAFAGRIIKDAVNAVIPLGGGISASTNRALLGLNGGTGAIIVGWGSVVTETGGADRSGQDLTIIVTGDGTGRDVYVNGVLADFAAASGGPNGSGGGMTLCAYNNGGTPSNFSDARIHAAMALDRRATPAEIQKIHQAFERTFQ